MAYSYDYKLKIIVIGDSGIGKTSLISCYVNEKPISSLSAPTIGVEYSSKIAKYSNKKFKTQIWDTAGQEKFRSITKNYYRDAIGVIICFSITNRNSFENLKSYLEDIDNICNKNIQKILVGTFYDHNDDRTVLNSEAINFANKHNVEYIEASSITGIGVNKCFTQLLKNISIAMDKKLLNIQKEDHKQTQITLRNSNFGVDSDFDETKSHSSYCCT